MVLDFKKNGIHSVKQKVGLLSNPTIIKYWFCEHNQEWKIVDFATIQTSKWWIVGVESLFSTLQFSKNEKDKALKNKTLFREKSKKNALNRIKKILKTGR